MKTRGLFVSAGGFSLINEQIRNALQSGALDFEWSYFDAAHNPFRNRPAVKLFCHLLAAVTFAPVIAKHRIPPRDLMVRLPQFQRCLTRALVSSAPNSDFTFQTQSLFDARVPGKPNFVYTDHTHLANLRYDPPRKTWPVSRAWLKMEDSLYKEAQVCFTSSRFAADSIVEDYKVPAGRVAVVHSGCNTKLPDALPMRNRAPRRILFLGVEWERKGGPVLFEAFKSIRQSFPDASLDIVGCSPAVEFPGIAIHGRVNSDAVPALLMKADIFCLPSLAEPSAAALAEASVYALPVVATRVGGTPERVIDGSTGLLVPPSNAKALADALSRLMQDGACARQMGECGRELILREFTWSAVADKILRRLREEVS